MPRTKTLRVSIEGMHCDACVRRVTTALSVLPGVTIRSVEVGTASLDYDDEATTPETIATAIRETGFETVV